MKIALFGLPEIKPGKYSLKDPRLDQVDKIMAKAKKRTYLEIELVLEELAAEAEAILAAKDSSWDLVLKDLDFVETRLSRAPEEQEKVLLSKLKNNLEKEELLFNLDFSPEEEKMLKGYGLLTIRPVILTEKREAEGLDNLLSSALKEAGYISFFTTGEKETRAWLIKKGTTAWEAAGVVHSDIQRGFIRAEVVSFTDLLESGSENQARTAGKLRLEQKDYLMQDADLVNFRFNK